MEVWDRNGKPFRRAVKLNRDELGQAIIDYLKDEGLLPDGVGLRWEISASDEWEVEVDIRTEEDF